MPAFKKPKPTIKLTDILMSADAQRVLAARRFMFQRWIDDVDAGRAF
jgi:hypothetical protein